VTARPRESVSALMLRFTGIDIERCPVCQAGRLRVAAILRPMLPLAPAVAITDTS
jgi:hypothetical protein